MEQRGRRHVKRNKSTMWSIQMQELRTTVTGCKYIKQISEIKDEWKDAYGENKVVRSLQPALKVGEKPLRKDTRFKSLFRNR